MPNYEATTKTLSLASNDFICNKENVLWLLGQVDLYTACPTFKPLLAQVKQLKKFITTHGLDAGKRAPGCTNCNARKAHKGQAQLVSNFARIFLWLYDADKMAELSNLRSFISAKKHQVYKRVILAHAGKATQGRERLVIVE